MTQIEQIEQSAVPADAGGLPTDESPMIERMRGLRSRWPSGSGVAVFDEACLGVVERTGPDSGGRGLDDRDAAPLGVRFAERYLPAVETAATAGRPPECRRPLLPYRRHPGVRPLQFALSGLQAHIGYDLVLAVVDSRHALGCAPPDPDEEFERVGDLLVSLQERIHEDLMPGPSCWGSRTR